MDQLPIPPVGQVQAPEDHIARIEAAPVIVTAPRLIVALLARIVLTFAHVMVDRLVTMCGQIIARSDDRPVGLAVVSAAIGDQAISGAVEWNRLVP